MRALEDEFEEAVFRICSWFVTIRGNIWAWIRLPSAEGQVREPGGRDQQTLAHTFAYASSSPTTASHALQPCADPVTVPSLSQQPRRSLYSPPPPSFSSSSFHSRSSLALSSLSLLCHLLYHDAACFFARVLGPPRGICCIPRKHAGKFREGYSRWRRGHRKRYFVLKCRMTHCSP